MCALDFLNFTCMYSGTIPIYFACLLCIPGILSKLFSIEASLYSAYVGEGPTYAIQILYTYSTQSDAHFLHPESV